MTKIIRCILYARFSPRPNAAECESCEAQLDELRQYAKKHGWEIAGEFSDKALSGDNDYTNRPAMFDAQKQCKRGMVFLVASYDRLFRNTRLALIFACDLESKGVEIVSVLEPAAKLKTPEAELMRTLWLAFAQYQRQAGNARTRARMLHHQKNGRRMSNEPPFGTMVDPSRPSHLITHTEEVATIDTIKQLYMGGATLRVIARELERRGIERRGKAEWSHVLVRRILIREGLVKRT